MPRVSLLALSCFLLMRAVLAADAGVKVEYFGGTATELKKGAAARLDLSGLDELTLRTGKTELRFAYKKVNTLEYGQSVSRRYAAAVLISPILLLSKSRKHFLTLGYVDEQGRQQAIVLRIGKGDIRSVLASLEARTGRRVEYQDDEARKAGRG
jgi:hypothetical protein